MENKKPNNPNAFPETEQVYDNVGVLTERLYPGMSLRDYFAAKAMQEILSKTIINESSFINKLKMFFGIKPWHAHFRFIDSAVSKAAYNMADQMLKEREK